MGNYRRLFMPGGTYFFTVVTANRRPLFSGDSELEILRRAYRRVERERPFKTLAAVILPDHIHCIWQLPDADTDFPGRWKKIKRLTINGLERTGFDGPFWQSRFWEHLIRDEEDLRTHMDYVHYNPVRHGFSERASDWAASSIHRYIRSGLYTADWAADPCVLDGTTAAEGEPRLD